MRYIKYPVKVDVILAFFKDSKLRKINKETYILEVDKKRCIMFLNVNSKIVFISMKKRCKNLMPIEKGVFPVYNYKLNTFIKIDDALKHLKIDIRPVFINNISLN